MLDGSAISTAELPDRNAADTRPAGREPALALLIARASYLLTGASDAQAKRLGLPPTEARILAALAERDGRDMTELARLVLLRQPTLTKAIGRLERARFVLRIPAEGDGRRTLARLTDAGRTRGEALLHAARDEEAALRQMLGDGAACVLAAALWHLLKIAEPPSRKRRLLLATSFSGASVR